ncbi:hypothetical protein ACFLQ5_01770 [Bacteroidota bacterium]
MKRVLLFFGIFLLCLRLSSQEIEKPIRIDIPAEHANGDHHIAALGSDGVIFISRSNMKNQEKVWVFTKYNTELKGQWSKEYHFRRKCYFGDFYYFNDVLYTYFIKKRFGKCMVEILKIDIKNETINNANVNIKVKANIVFSYFKVLDNKAFLVGNIKRKPVIVNIDLNSKKEKVIIPDIKGDLKVSCVNLSEEANVANVFIRMDNVNKIVYRNNNPIINEYNAKGKLNYSSIIKLESPKSLLDGTVLQVDENEKISIGLYNSPAKISNKIEAEADGLYFCNIIDGLQKKIIYHSFKDIANFRTFGRLLFHDEILVHNDKYLVVAERYTPIFHKEFQTGSDGKLSQVSVFDGYNYEYALVFAFDEDGSYLWYNKMDLGFLLQNLKERTKVLRNSTNDEIVLACHNGGNFYSKTITDSEIAGTKQSVKIGTKSQFKSQTKAFIVNTSKEKRDKEKGTYETKMEHWYDNNFITWGYQQIISPAKDKQQLFYFIKIAYDYDTKE